MRKVLASSAVAVVVWCLSVAARQDLKMTTYQLVVLKQGPEAAKMETPEGQKLLKDHVAFLYQQAGAGHYKVAGPFTDGGEIVGVIFVAAPTPERAREIAQNDPAMKAGLFTVEAMPFMSPENWFGKWAEFPNMETVYFGFLNNGPNRTHDPETAKQLQQQHLAYMEGQNKEGKLPVAGPFMTPGGIHRGIVVYRVADLEEARRRASGDPMIKAGRLIVDLHPWQVPVGALPK